MLDKQIHYLHVEDVVPLMLYEDIALTMIQCQTKTGTNGAIQSDQCRGTRYPALVLPRLS